MSVTNVVLVHEGWADGSCWSHHRTRERYAQRAGANISSIVASHGSMISQPDVVATLIVDVVEPVQER